MRWRIRGFSHETAGSHKSRVVSRPRRERSAPASRDAGREIRHGSREAGVATSSLAPLDRRLGAPYGLGKMRLAAQLVGAVLVLLGCVIALAALTAVDEPTRENAFVFA